MKNAIFQWKRIFGQTRCALQTSSPLVSYVPKLRQSVHAIVLLAITLFVAAGCATSENARPAAVCPNVSTKEIERFFDWGETVLIAETRLLGTPKKNGVGEWGRGFSGSIISMFSVRPLRFFKNAGHFPKDHFTVVDVEDYGADGGYQGGGLLPDEKAVSLIAITKSKSEPRGREVFASRRCGASEDR